LKVPDRALVPATLLLVFCIVAPLVPPPPAWSDPPDPSGTFWDRMFPGVPSLWVVARLGCLFAGSALLCLHRSRLSYVEPTPAPSVATTRPVSAQNLALATASVVAIAAFWAADFPRWLETLYFVGLLAPALVLGLAEVQGVASRCLAAVRRARHLLVLPGLWVVAALVTGWRSPRVASVVDMWFLMQRLADAAFGGAKVLSASAIPGLTNAYMMLEGVSLLGPRGLPLSFPFIQLVHVFWTAVAAVGVGQLVNRFLGREAALVAQATLLFSPFVLSFPLNPGNVYIMPLGTVVLALLLIAYRDRSSASAFLAFVAVAGFTGRIPQLTFVTAILGVGMLAVVSRSPELGWRIWGAASLAAVAAIVPGFPDLSTIQASTREFTLGTAQMHAILLGLFGQRSAVFIDGALMAGQPQPFDVPLAAILSPFVIARSPMRLLGDSLFDPIGTVLLALGIGASLIAPSYRRLGGFLLLLLATSMVIALTSSGDIVSHTRLAPALVPVSALAGIGFLVVADLLQGRIAPRRLAVATIASIIAAGMFQFHVVGPRILPASWMTIAMQAWSGRATPRPVWLDYGWFDCLHVERVGSLLPSPPYSTREYCGFERSIRTIDPSEVYFWSPALESDARVSCTICERWPEAALYAMQDGAGQFQAFAAVPPGVSWEPGVRPTRWEVAPCGPATRTPDSMSFCKAPRSEDPSLNSTRSGRAVCAAW